MNRRGVSSRQIFFVKQASLRVYGRFVLYSAFILAPNCVITVCQFCSFLFDENRSISTVEFTFALQRSYTVVTV